MPYRRRTYRKKSPLKRLTRSKKTTAIQTLAKQIQTIKRTMKKEVVLHNYHYGTRQDPGGAIGQALVSPFYAFHINPFNGWSRIFGTGANDQEANAMIWKSCGIDMHIRSYNESAEVNFTMFIVSLTDIASDLSVSPFSMVEATDYIQSSPGGTDVAAGLVMLNKKKFKIHYVRRFTLGNNGASLSTSTAQTQYGTDRRFYFKLRPNKKVVNPSGDVFALARDLDPSGNYYVLIFKIMHQQTQKILVCL